MSYRSHFRNCQRCGDAAYESLRSHGYCNGCGFSEVTEPNYSIEIPDFVLKQEKHQKTSQLNQV